MRGSISVDCIAFASDKLSAIDLLGPFLEKLTQQQ